MPIMPTRNADGLASIVPTEEEKYLFDTRGWLLLPSVLSEAEITEMREFCYRLRDDSQSLPPAERASIGGPLTKLIDHPRILGFMNEFVADPWIGSENGYGFRLESSFLTIRKQGDNNFNPHGGNGTLSFGHNSHLYRQNPGAVFSGLTRAVWELNPVQAGGGGTKYFRCPNPLRMRTRRCGTSIPAQPVPCFSLQKEFATAGRNGRTRTQTG